MPQKWVRKLGKHIREITFSLGGYLKAEATLILISFIISVIGLYLLKVIGMDINASLKRFETTLPEKYKLAEGECILNAVIFNIDDTTSKVTDIKRIYIR